jgi:hypothetical protein
MIIECPYCKSHLSINNVGDKVSCRVVCPPIADAPIKRGASSRFLKIFRVFIKRRPYAPKDFLHLECPNCNWMVYKNNDCHVCWQRIDWSDVEK